MGGVAINLKCEVLDKQKRVIPGLFAVGELTGLAGINGKASLEGTFLGPCILTGRVAGQSIVEKLSSRAPTRVEQKSCNGCHRVDQLIESKRPGFWHFDHVHERVLKNATDCRSCHAELAPYQKHQHKIDPQNLASSCVQCHVAHEIR